MNRRADLILETFPVGPLQCNCSIVGCATTRDALVIDPGEEPDRVIEALDRLGLRARALLHTHAHFDHIAATKVVAARTGALAALHVDDRPLYEHLADQTAWFGLPPVETPSIDRWLKDGDRVRAGEAETEVVHTPGHTPGSVCFRFNGGPLFTGDTLFAGSVGRTDLWGGSSAQLFESIRTRLLPLPDDTPVIPGHGPATTIGRERRLNPFVAALNP